MKKLVLIISFIFLISLFIANANIQCNFTAPNSIGNGTVLNATFNITENALGSAAWTTTVLFEARSASTRNSTFSFIANISNTTSLRYINYTFDVPILEDSNDYDWRATCFGNGTSAVADNIVTSSTNSNIIVDRTVPLAPTAITFTNPLANGDTISATINRQYANRCFVRFGGGVATRRAMTLSGSTCTFTTSPDNPPNSDYQAFIEADDRTNSTLSPLQSITIRARQSGGSGFFEGGSLVTDKSSGGQSSIGTPQNPFAQNNDKSILAFIILVGAFFYFKYKKG